MSYPDRPPTTEFEKSLRKTAEEIHPRASFAARLRAELADEQARRRTEPKRFAWARPILMQGGLVALLVGLVALALFLTPDLVPERSTGVPEKLPGQPVQGTGTPLPALPVGGDPNTLPTSALARLGQGQILAMDAAADGRLAVGSTLGICVYNAGHTPDWCMPFGLAYQINWLLFNPAGDRLALALGDWNGEGKLIVLDAASGSALAAYPLPAHTPQLGFNDAAIAWDPSGLPRLAVPGGVGTLLVWDWQSDAVVWGPVDIREAVSGDQPFSLDWALDAQGQSLLAAGGRSGLLLLDGLTGQGRLRLSPTWQAAPVGNIVSLDLSADGRWLAYGYDIGAVALRIEGGQVTDRKMWELHWSPMQLAIGPQSAGTPLAVQTKEGAQIIMIDGEGAPVTIPASYSQMAWDPQGTLYFPRADGMLGIYQNGEDNIIPTEYSVWPERIAWNGITDVLSLRASTINRWDTRSGKLGSVSRVSAGNLTLLAVSPDGARSAYYLEGEAAIAVWDTARNQQITRLEPAYRSSLAAFSADGSRLVTIGTNGQLAVWDASSGQAVREHVIREIDASPIYSQLDALAVSPDGRTAALAWARDSVLHLDLWDLEQGVKTHELPIDTNVTAMAFSPDGRTLAEAQSGYITLWDADSGQRVESMGPEYYPMATDTIYKEAIGRISAIAWAPDGKTLAAGGSLVVIYNAEQGLPLRANGGHRGMVTSLAYRADGLVLASGSADGTILLWDTGAGGLPLNELQPTATPLQVEPTAESVQPSPTPLPVEPSPTPLPASGEEDIIEESASPDGRWAAKVQHSVRKEGDRPVERVHTLTVQGPDGQNYSYATSERFTGPDNPGVSWSILKWWPLAPDALYWFETNQPNSDCEAIYSTNLRRMDLTTGQVEVLKGGADWRSPLVFSIDTGEVAYLEGKQVVVWDLEKDTEQRLDFEPIDESSWRVTMLEILPQGQGVLLAQQTPAAPKCESREVRQKVTLFDTARARKLEQTLPPGLEFRGYETAGFIIAADAQGALFRVDMSSGKVEPKPQMPGEEANEVLWDYLTALAGGADNPNTYQQAANLYGGSWDALMQLNPDVPGNNLPALLQRACEVNGYVCGPFQQIQTNGERDGFLFDVEYAGGTHGAFRVKKDGNGEYKVMDLPPRKE